MACYTPPGLFVVKQLRQVNSTVHLTGRQTEETKSALKRLFKPCAKHVSPNKVITRQTYPTQKVSLYFVHTSKFRKSCGQGGDTNTILLLSMKSPSSLCVVGTFMCEV